MTSSLLDAILRRSARAGDRVTRDSAHPSPPEDGLTPGDVSSYAEYLASPWASRVSRDGGASLADRLTTSAVAVAVLGPSQDRATHRAWTQLHAEGRELTPEDADASEPLWVAADVSRGIPGEEPIAPEKLRAFVDDVKAALAGRPGVGALILAGRGRISSLGAAGGVVDDARSRDVSAIASGQVLLSPEVAAALGAQPPEADPTAPGAAEGAPTDAQARPTASAAPLPSRGASEGVLETRLKPSPRSRALAQPRPTTGRAVRDHATQPDPEVTVDPEPKVFNPGDVINISIKVSAHSWPHLFLDGERLDGERLDGEQRFVCPDLGFALYHPPSGEVELEVPVAIPDWATRVQPLLLKFPSPTPPETLDEIVDRANEERKRSPQARAAVCVQRALESLGLVDVHIDVGIARQRASTSSDPEALAKARAAEIQGSFEEAIRYADLAIADKTIADPTLARWLHYEARILRGRCLRRMGSRQEATDELKQAREETFQKDLLTLAGICDRELARAQLDEGNPQGARARLSSAVELHTQDEADDELAKDAYLEGICLWMEGRLEDAIQRFAFVLGATGNSLQIAAAAQMLGACHHDLGDLQAAKERYTQALAAAEAAKDTPNKAKILGDLGLEHLGSGFPEEALRRFEEQLALLRAHQPKRRELILTAQLCIALALARHTRPEWDRVTAEAQAILEFPDADPAKVMVARCLLAEAALAQGDVDGARAHLLAVDVDVEGAPDEVVWRLTRARIQLEEALLGAAADPIPHYTRAVDVMDDRRGQLGLTHRVRFLDQMRPLVEDWMKALYAQGAWDGLILAVERTQGRALLDTQLLRARGAPDSDQRLGLFDGEEGLSAAQLRRRIPEGTALVGLHALDDRLLVTFSTRAGTAVEASLVRRHELATLASTVVRELSTPDGDKAALGAAARLAGYALAPVMKLLAAHPKVGTVGLMPGTTLYGVPLHALPVGDAGACLVDLHAVFYAPTMQAALHWSERGPGAQRSALVLSDPDCSLPESAKEGEEVQEALAPRFEVTRLFHGYEANLAALLEHGPSASVIHLAIHGKRARGRDKSCLLLAPTQRRRLPSLPPDLQEAGATGRVTASDLARLELDADLVVAGACWSSHGDLTAMGDGPDLLSWALLGAGARSVLASAWQLDDQVTRIFHRHFYAAWLDGHSKAEALVVAQRKIRSRAAAEGGMGVETLDLTHPYYWAGITLSGDWRQAMPTRRVHEENTPTPASGPHT